MVSDSHLEIFVVESGQGIAEQLNKLLSDARWSVTIVAGDRPLVALPEWTGPDVLLIGLDGDLRQRLAYTKRVQALYPRVVILGYTAEFTAEAVAQAMTGGVRRLLQFPFEFETLVQAVDDVKTELGALVGTSDAINRMQASQPATIEGSSELDLADVTHKLIAVFSPKGGVGTSTLAVNLAMALQVAGHPTALVDGNISFGSHEVFLSLQPTRSMLQLVSEIDQITLDAVMETLVRHQSGLQVLLAPHEPEEGDRIRSEHMKRIVELLKRKFQFTVVDTWAGFDDRVLAVLEAADTILVPFGPDMPSLKNLYSFLRVADLLHYDAVKIIPVLIRSDSVEQGFILNVETFLKRELRWRIVSDGKRATHAATVGTPFVLNAQDSQISRNVFELARFLAGEVEAAGTALPQKGPPAVTRRFWKR